MSDFTFTHDFSHDPKYFWDQIINLLTTALKLGVFWTKLYSNKTLTKYSTTVPVV